MLNKHSLEGLCKAFYICVIFFICSTIQAKDISVGVEWKTLFSTVKQIFDKNTFYGGRFNKQVFYTIPLTYRLLAKYPVTNNRYNFKHNLQWQLISCKENKPLLNITIANYLEEKNEEDIGKKEMKSFFTQKIISSWWLNLTFMHNLLETRINDRDCFCYGLGLNYSKMSVYYSKKRDMEESWRDERKIFYHHIWFNFSIFGKCMFGKHFSLATIITMTFLILMVKKTGEDDQVDIETTGTVIGYDSLPQQRFTFINSQPILTLVLYFEL